MGAASSKLDRAYGALIGMAIGDALGMPSQTMSPGQIRRHYGQIMGFVAPYPNHPVSHGLSAGQVTDDTEQALMLARRLVLGRGRIDEDLLAQDLLEWEAGVKARGLRDLLGPSSKAALDAMLAGSPVTETGRNGTTNGAAMRIAPIGIAVAAEPMSEFVDQVELACRMTHNTGEAIAAAAAVATVISCGVEGSTFEAAVPVALKAAEEGQLRGYPVGNGDIAKRISTALSCAKEGAAVDELAAKIGTSVASHESVAAAFGIVMLAAGDPWQAALIAANIGDDTDTIGAISCAMAGACSGADAVPKEAIETIATANSLPLEETARDLLSLRAGTDVPAHLGEAHA